MAHAAFHASNPGARGGSSTEQHPEQQSAALRGASLAFQKKQQQQDAEQRSNQHHSPQHQQKWNTNGALTAATLSAQSTGTSTTGLPDMDHWMARGVVTARLQQLGGQHQHPQHQQSQQNHAAQNNHHQQQYLQPTARVIDPKSPSFIAATLAASRSASPSPKARTPRRKTSVGTASVTSDHVDSGSIPPTNSLISMFEQGKGEPVKATLLSTEPVERTDKSQETMRPGERALLQAKVAKQASRDSLRVSPSPSSRKQDVTAKSSPAPKRDAVPVTPVSKNAAAGHGTGKQASSSDLRQLATLPQQPAVPKKPEKPGVQDFKPTVRPSTPPLQHKSVPRITNRYDDSQQAEDWPLRSPPTQRQVVSQPQEVVSPKPKRLSKPKLEPPMSPEARVLGSPQSHVQASPGDPQKKSSPAPKLQPIRRQSPPPAAPKPRKPSTDLTRRHSVDVRTEPRRLESATVSQKSQAPTPPKPRGTKTKKAGPSPDSRPPQDSPKPQSSALNRKKTFETSSSTDVFFSAPTSPEQGVTSPPLPRRQSTVSQPPSPTHLDVRRRRPSATPSNANLGLDSLTSAIMAGSLASKRLTPHNTGSSLPPPAPPRRQKSPHLRQTLRGPLDSSDDDDAERNKRTQRRHKIRPGRHAHHEGSRKKWRDEIRPRERKRYEAIWASNRGMLLSSPSPSASPSPQPSIASSSIRAGREGTPQPPVVVLNKNRTGGLNYADCVANVVVRDIWRRSRLPEDELAEVWALVDREQKGILTRQEFVVGMWLIDQRLKGRKIPTKVTESVWGSASGNGLTVRGPR